MANVRFFFAYVQGNQMEGTFDSIRRLTHMKKTKSYAVFKVTGPCMVRRGDLNGACRIGEEVAYDVGNNIRKEMVKAKKEGTEVRVRIKFERWVRVDDGRPRASVRFEMIAGGSFASEISVH